jgi:hypothetical protein
MFTEKDLSFVTAGQMVEKAVLSYRNASTGRQRKYVWEED